MNDEEIVTHLKSLGFIIEKICGEDSKEYFVIKNYIIPTGNLKDKRCDLAFMATNSVPYIFPSAIHTNPHLVPMDTGNNQNAVCASTIGKNWQYWSRRLDKQPTPKNIVAHIITVFRDVKNES